MSSVGCLEKRAHNLRAGSFRNSELQGAKHSATMNHAAITVCHPFLGRLQLYKPFHPAWGRMSGNRTLSPVLALESALEPGSAGCAPRGALTPHDEHTNSDAEFEEEAKSVISSARLQLKALCFQ